MNIDTVNTVCNATIGVSCFIIACQLVRFLIKRWKDGVPFRATLILAAALFFFTGGIGQLVLTLFLDNDILDLISRAMTALISLLTAVLVTLSVDRALKMKTPRQFEELEAQKDRALESLRHEYKLLLTRQHGRRTAEN